MTPRSGRLVCFVVIALALGPALSLHDLRAEVVEGVEASYKGKHSGTEAFESLRGAVVGLRARSLAVIRETLGIYYNDDPAAGSIVVRFLDADAARALGFPGTSRGGVGEQALEGRPSRVVHLITDRFLGDCADLPGVLVHEMVHAVMLGYMGESYLVLPPWIQEGLAVYASGQGPEKLLRAIRERGGKAEGLVDGLERHRESIGDYAEDWLAFDFMRARYGEAAVKRFVGDLMRGAGAAGALRAATGLGPSEFEREAREHSERAAAETAARIPSGASAPSTGPRLPCSAWVSEPDPAAAPARARSTRVDVLAGPLYKVTDERGGITIVDSYEKIP